MQEHSLPRRRRTDGEEAVAPLSRRKKKKGDAEWILPEQQGRKKTANRWERRGDREADARKKGGGGRGGGVCK